MSSSPALRDVSHLIITVRDQKVILDADLAALYHVSTKVFNQAVKRNLERFPGSFRFQLTREEFDALRSQIVTSNQGRGGRRYLPFAFTEHGALMAANVLNSPPALKMSVALIEAFIRLRQEFASTQMLARRLAEIERVVIQHDASLKELFRAIKPLLIPPPDPPRRRIGFHSDNE